MPTRHSVGVPRFDPADVKSLAEYFEDFELLAAGAHLSDMEKIKYAHRYVPREEADFWTSLPEFEAVPADWEAYKQAILEGYPGSTSADRWTSKDFIRLSNTQARQPITSLEEFSVFHRKISAMGSWLIKDKRLDDLEFRTLYLEAIEPGLRHQIQCHLCHFLRQHDHSRPYQVKDIRDTAYYVLDPLTIKLYPRLEVEVPHSSVPEHPTSEAKKPPSDSPACPVTSHPPKAPELHTPQSSHLVSEPHVPAHSIHVKPSRQCQSPHPPAPSFAAYSSSCLSKRPHHLSQPKRHTPAEAKEIKAKQEELDRLLDLFVRELEQQEKNFSRMDPYPPAHHGPADFGPSGRHAHRRLSQHGKDDKPSN